jgi:hypothetical protein
MDGAGNIYDAASDDRVVRISPAGVVTQLMDGSGDGAGHRLTGDVWDADGLVSDRGDTETAAVAAEARETPSAAAARDVGGVRDAGATLLRRLAPQERAAVVLKDVFAPGEYWN